MRLGRPRWPWLLVLAVAALGVGVGAGYAMSPGTVSPAGGQGAVAGASSAASPSAGAASPTPPTTIGPAGASTAPSVPPSAPAASPGASSSAPLGVATGQSTNPSASTATASAKPGASAPAPTAAPTSAVKFDPRRTVVPMAFPLPAAAKYRYGAAWRTPRLGIVYPYNQIRAVGPGGVLLRAHDGVDLEVPIGTPVMAPFAGIIVNPAAIWKPWDPERYGTVVVVRSTEATSRGYFAILVHLSSKAVRVGDRVSRGQIVGKTGISGNAAETTPHLHFELRAPFPITFHYAGVERVLDDFDPLPSLRSADPKLR